VREFPKPANTRRNTRGQDQLPSPACGRGAGGEGGLLAGRSELSRSPLLAFGRLAQGDSRLWQRANGKPPAHAERYVLPEGHLAAGEESCGSLGHSYYIYGLPGESPLGMVSY
jgi:hypothetical protein